jgi:N-acetylglucosaminyl-diphospho-decaprenol L-rhamnosyltransferase
MSAGPSPCATEPPEVGLCVTIVGRMEPAVTAAVVSWNTRDHLANCLDSFAAEVEVGRAEVWVVDNGSSDGSQAMVRERYDWARLIESEENLGFGPAVNLVAERTGGQWIAAANADVELTPGALDTLRSAGEHGPQIGALAPRLILHDGSTQHSVHSFPTLALAVLTGLGIPRLSRQLGDRLCLEDQWDPDRARRVDWAHGAFLLVRREAFEAIGGFDARQWMYAEDIDLAWRLAGAGFSVRYEPAALVRHAVSAATTQAFGQAGRDQRHIAATYAWMLRRRGHAMTKATAFANFAAAAARYGLLTPLMPLGGRWVRSRRRALRYARLHRLGLRSRTKLLELAPD